MKKISEFFLSIYSIFAFLFLGLIVSPMFEQYGYFGTECAVFGFLLCYNIFHSIPTLVRIFKKDKSGNPKADRGER